MATTTRETLRDRLPDVDFASTPADRCPGYLERAGVAPADIVVYARADKRLPVVAENDPCWYLFGNMARLATVWPDLSVRACVGWVLLDEALFGSDLLQLIERTGPWVEAGLGEDGWLCVAAGLGVAEACEVAACGDPARWDGVRVLAGLSGLPLPETT